MNPLVIYIIEVLLASTLLGSFYFLFFRNLTFFRFNRYYLLASLVLPLLFPLITLPISTQVALPNVSVLLDEVTIGAEPLATSASDSTSILPYLYLAISLILIVRMLIGITSIIKLLKSAHKHTIENTHVYVSPQAVNPFSVFKRIVVSEDTFQEKQSLPSILLHERTHILQLHGLDVFIAESLCALFWFNPIQWLLKKELKSTHEYLADEKVLEQDFDLAGYFMLMFDNIVGRNVGLANNFNQSLNLKRMKMMKKKRSSRFVKVLSMMAMPLIMGATIMLTSQCSTQEENNVDEEVFMVVEQMPKFVGGDQELMNYLRKNIKFPAEAQENGIQGRVYVEFVVSNIGEICNVKILKGVDPILDAEALRVVNTMPDWEPGMQRGKHVNVSYRLPINFTLK